MSVVDLLSNLEFVSPHARYVALRLACLVGVSDDPHKEEERLLELGIKGLAKELALPDLRMSESIRQLLAVGVLEQRDNRAGGGRPRKLFRFSTHFRERLRLRPSEAECHVDLITTLMEQRTRRRCAESLEGERIDKVRALRQPGRLSALNCLFASVLYAYADGIGVVENVGARLLGRLTGLDAAGVKHQIDRLVALGFIISHVPGGVTKLLAHKRKSLYVMNLGHVIFKPGKAPTLLPIAPPGPRGWGWTQGGVTARVQELVQLKAQNSTRSLLQRMISWGESAEGRMQFLWASEDIDVFFRWLPWIVCGYVERMLRVEGSRGNWTLKAVSDELGSDILEDFPSQRVSEEKWVELWNHLLPDAKYEGLLPQPRWAASNQQGTASNSDAIALVGSYVQEVLHEIAGYLSAIGDEAYSCVRLLWLGNARLVLALPGGAVNFYKYRQSSERTEESRS